MQTSSYFIILIFTNDCPNIDYLRDVKLLLSAHAVFWQLYAIIFILSESL